MDNNNNISIICPGSVVSVGDIKVIILAVLLRGNPAIIQYEISWFYNGDRKSAWVESFELTNCGPSDLKTIGLREV